MQSAEPVLPIVPRSGERGYKETAWGSVALESNQRYYARRATEELRAAARAVTPEARARRRALAELFASKAQQYAAQPEDPRTLAERLVSPAGFEPATY